MGIPNFYSWLLQKYPQVKIPCKQDDHSNGIECDNLYLDMNQIIHKCTQSNDENEMIQQVCVHIDRIVSIIHPRQLLYMAIDGVTPRARMTHQRTNRFLKSKNIPDGLKDKIFTNDRHQIVPTDTFDECNIKPGTKFMSKLSQCLQSHIRSRMNEAQDWHSLKTILSDANVPGEGEHKIIHFLRQQRHSSDYNPTTYHVVYGSDSDLVLLGLLAHEQNFRIICEECDDCGKIGHGAKDCDTIKYHQNNMETKYVLIDLSKLRDCLIPELQKKNSFSLERKPDRSIDDWVFICLLFGNDILPKSPSINFFDRYISMDHLINVYREEHQGYITKDDTINMDRLVTFLKKVGEKDLNGKICRQSYYERKFSDNKTPLRTLSFEITINYVRGLCWLFQYYYRGPPSWNWYYPYYYAPLACDFANLLVQSITLNFDQDTKPFSPFEQMMATFSPQNAEYLPLEWQSLMFNGKISDFYPQNFEIDPDGRQKSSQYVVLIKSIDENRLLEALEPVYSTLTEEEEKRNTLDYDRLFIHSKTSYYQELRKLNGNDQKPITEDNPFQLQKIPKGGLIGDVWTADTIDIDNGEEGLLSEYTNKADNQVICFKYRDSLISNESVGKDINLQTASNQFKLGSTTQSQQGQAFRKPSPWGKPT